MPRRFPPPWIVGPHNQACFIVKDATGRALAYVYFEDEETTEGPLRCMEQLSLRLRLPVARKFLRLDDLRRGHGFF
jgi:hypothetical protein